MRTIGNVLSNWGAFVAGTVITLVLSPFVVHSLGDVRYGVWGIIGGLVGYLGLLDLGIRVAVTRYVAHHDAKGDQDAVNRFVSTAFCMFVACGCVAAVVGFAAAGLLPFVVQLPSAHTTEAIAAVAISSFAVAAALIGGVYGGLLAGLQRFPLMHGIGIGIELLRAAIVYVALRAGGGLVDLALIQLAAVTLRGLLTYIAARRTQPGLRTARRLFDARTMREILTFSGYTMILHVSGIVIFSSDAIVIGMLMPVTHVAFFVIAGNLAAGAFRVLGGVSQALYPLVSARQAAEGTRATTGLLTGSSRLGALVILPILLTLLLRGRTFIALWMGPEYADTSGAVLEILALGLCFFASYQMLVSTMTALNLHRGLVPFFVGEASLNLALSVVLGLTTGITGVAWGTTLPRIALCLGFGPRYARKHLGVAVREYARHAWIRPFASMVPFAGASLLIEHLWQPSSLLTFMLQVAAALPVAGLGAAWVGLERQERLLVGRAVAQFLGFAGGGGGRPAARATSVPTR